MNLNELLITEKKLLGCVYNDNVYIFINKINNFTCDFGCDYEYLQEHLPFNIVENIREKIQSFNFHIYPCSDSFYGFSIDKNDTKCNEQINKLFFDAKFHEFKYRNLRHDILNLIGFYDNCKILAFDKDLIINETSKFLEDLKNKI